MSKPRLRVLAVASHPVQYSAPLFRLMAQHPRLDFRVAYCSLRGAQASYDAEFGTTVKWDVPMLEGYSWTHVGNRFFRRETYLRLFNPGLWPLIRKGNFDAILCSVSYRSPSFWIAYVAAKVSGSAFLFGTDTSTLAARDSQRWKAVFKRAVWPFLFGLADQVMVPSSGAREFMRRLGIEEGRVTVTPHCVDNSWWVSQSSQVDRANVRGAWGAASNDFVILYCAKLQPWKRPYDVLEAFAKLNEPHSLLVFAGDGPLRSELESRARAIGIAPRVRFVGFVNQSQLPAVYVSADLMVLPSAYEPFGLVVNEALCCGCPVVASDRVGAAAELIAPVERGFIFRCGDVVQLANILRDASANRPRLRKVAERGTAHVQTRTPEHNVSATVEAIECAISRVQNAGPAKSRVPAAGPSSGELT